MQARISDAQWAAGRALIEGEPSTHARVAAAMGIHTTSLSHRASEYSWVSLDFRHPRVRAAQRGLVALAAAARAGHELDPVSLLEGEGFDEAGWDAIAETSGSRAALAGAAVAPLPPLAELPEGQRAARLRAMLTSRMEEMVRHAEAGRPIETRQVTALAALAQIAEKMVIPPDPVEARQKSDDELADIYDRIDERITVLAKEYAAQILVETGLSESEANDAVDWAA